MDVDRLTCYIVIFMVLAAGELVLRFNPWVILLNTLLCSLHLGAVDTKSLPKPKP